MELTNKKLNLSTGPHVRSPLTTRKVMADVLIALMPATINGIIHFGFHAFCVVMVSVLTAMLVEGAFCWAAKKPCTVGDLSAAVTGLMLALCLPAGVPLYIPFLGSLFAILVVKCLFGGLGKNIMNPALAGRCFLLISFASAMTNYSIDGITAATPLARYSAGKSIDLMRVFLGFDNGVIGCSIAALLLGGLYLLIRGGITWEIPVCMTGSYAVAVYIFSGRALSLEEFLFQICSGGVLMGALFMATDPVTSPVTSAGHIAYGLLVGTLCALFRVKGSLPDSVSYAIIMSNLLVPFIDLALVKKPYAYREPRNKKQMSDLIPRAAVILAVITLCSGFILGGLNELTKDTIASIKLAANAEAYRAVMPDAETFGSNEAMDAAIAALDGGTYGTDFGRATINEAIVGKDASGNVVGTIISATSGDGMEGNITLAVGISADGTVLGISFTELNETPGLGSLCGESPFKDQFNGVQTTRFSLDNSATKIDSVAGATISSRAVVNAINAALDFYAANAQ